MTKLSFINQHTIPEHKQDQTTNIVDANAQLSAIPLSWPHLSYLLEQTEQSHHKHATQKKNAERINQERIERIYRFD
jgi:hypothetical protein